MVCVRPIAFARVFIALINDPCVIRSYVSRSVVAASFDEVTSINAARSSIFHSSPITKPLSPSVASADAETIPYSCGSISVTATSAVMIFVIDASGSGVSPFFEKSDVFVRTS